MSKWKKINDEKKNLYKEIEILKKQRINNNISYDKSVEIEKSIKSKMFKYKLICYKLKELNERKNE